MTRNEEILIHAYAKKGIAACTVKVVDSINGKIKTTRHLQYKDASASLVRLNLIAILIGMRTIKNKNDKLNVLVSCSNGIVTSMRKGQSHTAHADILAELTGIRKAQLNGGKVIISHVAVEDNDARLIIADLQKAESVECELQTN